MKTIKSLISSADLAAEAFKKSNGFTYLRLEGYGHDLDTIEIQDVACRWLAVVLSGKEILDNAFMVQADISKCTLQTDDMSEYVFSRGKDKDNGGERGGKISGSIGGSRDSDGNESVSGDLRGTYDFGNGFKGNASVGGSYGQDSDGNTRKEAHGKLEGSYEF